MRNKINDMTEDGKRRGGYNNHFLTVQHIGESKMRSFKKQNKTKQNKLAKNEWKAKTI